VQVESWMLLRPRLHLGVIVCPVLSRMKLPAAAYSAEVATSATKAGSYGVFGEGESSGGPRHAACLGQWCAGTSETPRGGAAGNRCRATVPSSTLSAANRQVVPWRL
jgi:hypothetical protein